MIQALAGIKPRPECNTCCNSNGGSPLRYSAHNKPGEHGTTHYQGHLGPDLTKPTKRDPKAHLKGRPFGVPTANLARPLVHQPQLGGIPGEFVLPLLSESPGNEEQPAWTLGKKPKNHWVSLAESCLFREMDKIMEKSKGPNPGSSVALLKTACAAGPSLLKSEIL